MSLQVIARSVTIQKIIKKMLKIIFYWIASSITYVIFSQ
ncbi:hypothetical protein RMAECT_1321 [Rickettsia rhipicephali str. Ect]|uniref:Uncharacterized protein n=1 Tax=Rickettsia rhipicephali str. Ect TaxID=1359199 RepID=A0A0F3PD79_RICRH|nr:hypothetical protein RMAECT_1321 [Rickettsia rhipicephali str. Ect]